MGWDLIGVAGIPEAADEYDCMISPLLHRLFGAGPNDTQDRWLAESLTSW
jgi:hypothetical protein